MRISKAGHDIVRLTTGVSMPVPSASVLDKPRAGTLKGARWSGFHQARET